MKRANLKMELGNDLDKNKKPRLYFYASKPISTGMEFLYDYGDKRKNVVDEKGCILLDD